MDVKELRKNLRLQPQTINLIGKEEFFLKQAIQEISTFFVKKDTEDFNLVVIGGESDKEIATYLREAPYYSDYKVVFLREAEKFKRFIGDTTVAVAIDGSFSNPQLTVDCSSLYGNSLSAFVRKTAKEKQLTLDKEDIHLFIQLNGNNIFVLESELAKLELLGMKSNKILSELAMANVQTKLGEFIDKLMKKDLKGSLTAYDSLVQSGYTDGQLLGFFVYFLRKLFFINFVYKESEEEKLDFDMRRYLKYKGIFDYEFFYSVFTALHRAEDYIRQGDMPFVVFIVCFFKRKFELMDRYIRIVDEPDFA